MLASSQLTDVFGHVFLCLSLLFPRALPTSRPPALLPYAQAPGSEWPKLSGFREPPKHSALLQRMVRERPPVHTNRAVRKEPGGQGGGDTGQGGTGAACHYATGNVKSMVYLTSEPKNRVFSELQKKSLR